MEALGALCLCWGGICFMVALGLFVTQQGQRAAARRGARRPAFGGAPARPMRTMPEISTGGAPMATGVRGDFQRARIGQNITVKHPQRGAITGKILGSIRYTELWQRAKSPSEPWVPTGNEYTAHWLGNFMLYEWKDQLFLLDQYDALTDKDIMTNFAPYAKRFGESNETADVYFAYPPASWKMADIGKFHVRSADGSGLRLTQGATGRFIHATGEGCRALVVEDYQSGSGGQDTAWIGYMISWDDIQKIN